MFARNTWLTRQAFDVLESTRRYRLYGLERLVLDRDAVWPGCAGTLTDFGWGFLGEIQKHAKMRIGQFTSVEEMLEPEDFLVFAAAPQIGTSLELLPDLLYCVTAPFVGHERAAEQRAETRGA